LVIVHATPSLSPPRISSLLLPPPPRSTLFPYTTLFRSRGAVFDVAVDLRAGSETYGKWYGVELTAENKKQFYIPEGFAHGFLVRSEEHTSELQSRFDLVCRLLLEKKK